VKSFPRQALKLVDGNLWNKATEKCVEARGPYASMTSWWWFCGPETFKINTDLVVVPL